MKYAELKTIYASADIFAAPSVTAENGDQEGLPTTIINGYQTRKKYDYSSIANEYNKILEDISFEGAAVRNSE